MANAEFSKRWSEPSFLAEREGVFNSLFVSRNPVHVADLRGLVVGLDGAPASLYFVNFTDARIESADFSWARFSCGFWKAQVDGTRFAEADFDTCNFKDARLANCDFESARVDSPTFDDAVFLRCAFTGAVIQGRGITEYGGRRTVFEQCDFTKTLFQNLQFRACIFRQCNFRETLFKRCLMVGVKFEGGAPNEDGFISCHS